MPGAAICATSSNPGLSPPTARRHVAGSIRLTRDILERRIAIENTPCRVAPAVSEMSEKDFIRALLTEAERDLHREVDNV